MDFIGREEEISVLEYQYSEIEHPFVIIRGQSYVGKSRLVHEFIKEKDALFFQAKNEKSNSILESFYRQMFDSIKTETSMIGSWTDAIESYLVLKENRRTILVIDNFQYIIKDDRNALYEFQSIWDNILSQHNVMFIICGSNHSGMEIITRYDKPLYGRNTCDIHLRPLAFRTCIRGMNYRHAVEEYAFTGGLPQYVQLIDHKKSVIENIKSLTMKEGASLVNDVPYLMGKIFNDLASYNTYLKTIAQGNLKMDSICSSLRVKSNEVTPYLKKLLDYEILERRVPITETQERSRNGLYVISDNFISAWFKFVYPYRNDIALGNIEEAERGLEKSYIINHVAFIFKDISRGELRRALTSEKIAASYGSFWNGNCQIDVVAIDKKNKTLYAGECKYWVNPVGRNILTELMNKCLTVRDFKDYHIVYCLFSVSGYNDNLMTEDGIEKILFNNGEIIKDTRH